MQSCLTCPLADSRRGNCYVGGQGPLDASIMVVGEAPGKLEARKGLPFIGDSGVRLNTLLEHIGVEREAVYITNVVKWRPPKNRTPKVSEIKACTPNLIRELKIVQPDIVLAMGAVAAKWFDPTTELLKDHGYPRPYAREWLYREMVRGKKLTARQYRLEDRGYDDLRHGLRIEVKGVVVPLYHPAYTLRNPSLYPELVRDFETLGERLHAPPPSTPLYRLATNATVLRYIEEDIDVSSV